MERSDLGTTSRSRRSSCPKDQFIDLLLSWSTQDIFDENLYKNQVEDIPKSFESVDRYLHSFTFPLLEETRAELASSMETVYKAPFAEITSFTSFKGQKNLYSVKVDHWRNRQSDGGKEAYRTLPGDIVLVSNMKPETASDLGRAGWTFTYACVKNISEDESGDDCSPCNFKVTTAEHIEAGEQQSELLYVVFLINVTTQKRIWNALGMRQNLSIIEKVLSKDDLGDENCALCPFKYNSEMDGELKQAFSSKVNESQLEAILASLTKVNCHHKPSVELIWGPPGTGKTTTVSILLYSLLRKNVRTLVCAPTNVAIRELASRVLALVRNSFETESEYGILSCPLGDMLIFGNKDRLKVGSDIQDIYSDYRVDKLVECLASFNNWKFSVSSMLDFLEDCVSKYQTFVENEQINAKQSPQKDGTKQSELKSLLEFSRDRFSHLAPPLRKCMLTFITHLPTSFIHHQTLKNIEKLMLHLDSIETVLFEDACSITCDELESVFLKKAIPIGSEPFVDASSLMFIRNECISILRSVQSSLSSLSLPNPFMPTDKDLTTEFCFQKACLIFCTTSSSFKLNEVDMEPFRMLVIDEAAQVKECESIIPLQILDARHTILVGDEKQLPSTVNSKLAEEAGFGRSLFERLSSLGHSKHLLNVQYRMHPSISRFPNSNFYLNQILDAPSVQRLSYEKRYLEGTMFGPYSFINVRDGKEEFDDIGHSRRNMVEVAVVVMLVQKLYKAWNGSNENLSIGLISPYAAQVVAIRNRLQHLYENHKGFTVKMKSVDEFQGGEEDIIIISTVRSHKGGSIGFMDSLQRTNVALTRARHCLWILGNERTLSKSDSVWEAIVSDAKRRKCFFNADEDPEFEKTVIEVKKELEQLDDLLSGECVLFRNSRWKVLLSENFRKSFQKLKPSNVKKLVLNVLLKLASGWRFRNLEVRKSWSDSADIIRFKNSNNTVNIDTGASGKGVENSKVNESLLLMKFDSLSSTNVNHFLTDLKGRELVLPFEVTDEEREIIMLSRSSFILGRSGTGKTTILTIKLFQKFQQYSIALRDTMETNDKDDFSEGLGETSGNIPRQLFVTVSPKLCHAVKQHVSQLQSFASGNYTGNKFTDMDDIDEMAEFRDIPDKFVGIEREKYPLVITFHKFLMMLDGTLGKSYFERFHDSIGSSQCEGRRSVALNTFIRRNEVTYDRFRSFYWTHFNAKLTKNHDPSIVFSEIMFHIKGACPQHGEACDIKRSRRDYILLADSRVSTLTAEKRERIYDMFEDYEKLKLERGEFDLGDFVMDIHLRLENEDLMGDKMDFVYIDEVQDLTMSQISLFKYICKNVDEGFVFCGDTAQTIDRGIDFRFEDIRSLFYKDFFMKNRNYEVQGRGKGLTSDTICLSQNFRTHTGVLRLAHSVIDVICHFFPHSIDVLPPETSLIYGDSPVVLEPRGNENLFITIFGHSGKAGGKWVGFGADQVILVRDDCARKEVSNYIGHQALILTIVECKGLEFQDVLLYNFFGSSPLNYQWRVVYEFLQEEDLLDPDSPFFPTFSQSKHNILFYELKQLYVAITRTRQRLWICENNEELSKPMLDYWKRLCLVQVRKVDDSLAETMQRASSPKEWKSQGINLFWENNYEMATLCFEKAGDEMWEKRAKASGLRRSADTLRVSNPELSCVMLREAADIFDSIGRADSSAECFCDLGEYERAENIYLKCGTSELRKAGECFSLAGSYRIAAEVYAKGNLFDECLSSCTKGNYFDLSLQYIKQWRQQASRSSGVKDIHKLAQEFLEKSALECFKKKDSILLMKIVRAFNTVESMRNFLKTLDCVEELLILEEESGNFDEAAKIAKSLGDTLREVDLLEKSGDYANASSLIISYVLSNSLWLSGSNSQGWPLKSFPQKEELLVKAMSVSQKVTEVYHSSICAEADVLMTCEQMKLSEFMELYSASKEYNTYTGEILSVRKLLDSHLQVHSANYDWDIELCTDPILFDHRTLKNQVTCKTLVYVWDLWKAKIMEILDCLDSLDDGFEGIVRFCLDYFGVRLTNNSSATYLLLKPDAAWIGIDRMFIMWNRTAATLDARHFASSAQKYWRQELISTGIKVLEALQVLHKISLTKSLSKLCQSLCLTCIYDVTRFFLNESSLLDMRKGDERKLQTFLHLLTEYFDLVFPMDPRQCLSNTLISLRETEISKNLLEEVISRNISSTQNELTHGQIGRSLMIMLGFGKTKHDLNTRISERIGVNSPWKPIIENLNEIMEFQRALEESLNARWRENDCISPHCFFYLVERLLILAPHSQGSFYTRKSSFVEYLMCLQLDTDPSSSFSVDNNFYPRNLFEYLAEVVQQSLYNSRETAGWIKKSSHRNCEYYFPVLMLRLIMILCLLCLTSFVHFNVLFQALNTPQINSQLPIEFCEAFWCRKNNNSSNVSAIAAAFKVIGDPLMIVSSTGARPKLVTFDAIFVDLKSFSCRNEILKVLFPPVEKNTPESSSTVICPVVSNMKIESTIKSDTNLSLEDGKGNTQINWGLIREMSEALESLKNRNDKKMKSLILKKKDEIEEHASVLSCVVEHFGEEVRSCSGKEDKIVMCTGVIEELNQICSLLGSSGVDLKAQSNDIGKLLKSLETRRPQLDALFSQLKVQNDPDIVSVDDKKVYNSSPVTEDRKSEDLAAADVGGKNHSKVQGAGCSQAQGKGSQSNKNNNKNNSKNNNKNKSKNGGRGRRR